MAGTETHIRQPARGGKSPGRGAGVRGGGVCLLLVAAAASLAKIKSGLGLFKKREIRCLPKMFVLPGFNLLAGAREAPLLGKCCLKESPFLAEQVCKLDTENELRNTSASLAACPSQGLQLCFLRNTDHLCQQSSEHLLREGGQRAEGGAGRHTPIP